MNEITLGTVESIREALTEPLLVDLANVRELMRLLEQHVRYHVPDVQTRVSLEVMGRRLDAVIETSESALFSDNSNSDPHFHDQSFGFRSMRVPKRHLTEEY